MPLSPELSAPPETQATSQTAVAPSAFEPLPSSRDASRLKAARANYNEKTPYSTTPTPLLKRYEAFFIPCFMLFILGNALAYAFPALPLSQPMIGGAMISILVGIALYGVNHAEKRWALRMAFCLILLIVGCLYYPQRHFQPASNDAVALAPIQQAEIKGIVQQQTGERRLLLKLQQVNGRPVSGQSVVYLPYNTGGRPIDAGARVLVIGDLERPFESPVPGAFNQTNYLATQKISSVIRHVKRLVSFETSDAWPYPLQRFTEGMKDQVSRTFRQALPSPQADIFGGLVLGDKAVPVDSQTRQSFIQTGLIHLLAASGMNVGIIAGAVFWLMSLLKVPYRFRLVVAMVAVGFYSLVTGLPPSIQRASVMLELALLLKLLNRQLSPLFLLCLASAFLVALSPDNVGSIGFQFSVLTTFGLIAMVPPLQDAIGYYTTRWLAGLVLVPAIAQLWIMPLSVAYFNQFPLHSIPLNIAALVLVAPLTVLGFTAALVSLVFPPMVSVLAWVAKPLLDGLLSIAQVGHSMQWAQWMLPSPAGWQIVLMYACLFGALACLYRFKDWPKPRRAFLILIPLLLLLGGACLEKMQSLQQAHIELLPLSHNREAYLVKPAQTEERMAILPERLTYSESRLFADYLKHQNLHSLRAVMLLPEQRSVQEQLSDGPAAKNYLKSAFQKTHVDLLLTFARPAQSSTITAPGAGAVSPPQTLPLLRRQEAFPETGAAVQFSTLTLEGHADFLRLMSQNTCLMGIEPPTSASFGTEEAMAPQPGQRATQLGHVPGCALRLSDTESVSRFGDEQPMLAMDRYYRLVQEGRQLAVYANP